MNIFQKVTLKNLKENRIRTLVTIIGIILSAAMFTATTISISSMQHYLVQSSIYNDGNWYGTAQGVTAAEIESICADAEVEQAVSMEFLGFSALEGCLNNDKPYLCVYGIQQDFTEMMPIHLLEGRMPENRQEILLPGHLKSNGGIGHALEDSLELDLGNRISQDGQILLNHTAYTNDINSPSSQNDAGSQTETDLEDSASPDIERLVTTEKRTYTVVGFYERPSFEDYDAPGYTALTIGDGDSGHPYDIFIRTVSGKNCATILENMISNLHGVPLQAELPATMDSISGSDGSFNESGVVWRLNYDLLRYYGYSGENRYNEVMYGLAVILMGIILFGSISLIYNAFSISVSERTKQFGLLASIGATKRQLTGSVLFEALFLGCIGIPLGILSGLAGIGITFYFIQDMVGDMLGIVSTSYEAARLADILGPVDHVALTMHPSFGALAIAVLISFGTILISAYIPVQRAVRKSAIDAIRQTDDITIRPGKVKTSRLTQKLFGFEGSLATKNYKRNRKKYRATVISLFLSIVLFISTSSWCTYLTAAADTIVSDSGYDILYHLSSESDVSADSLMADLSSVSGVDYASYETSLYLSSSIETSALSKEYQKYLEDFAEQSGFTYQKHDLTLLNFMLHFLEDGQYRSYLKEQNLPESIFYNPDAPKAVAVDTLRLYNENDQKFYSFPALANATAGSPTIYLTKTQGDYDFQERYMDEATGKPYYRFYNYSTDEEMSLPIEDACLALPLSIGATAKRSPSFFSNENDTIQLFYPYSFLHRVIANLEPGIEYMEVSPNAYYSPRSVDLFFKCKEHNTAEAAMVKKLADWNLTSDSLYNYAASKEGERAMMTVINVLAFGFITLISLIAAANVFNTISTNINLRRREFAMLKSIGLTPKGFRKMMDFECLLYGVKGLLYGIPVSFGVTWLIYRTISNGLEGSFFIPWYSIAIAVGSVFLVVFSTMVYSMRKIRKENTIDALKNENL